MPQYWFKPHDYGYGATPVTWQGWGLVLAVVFVVGAMTALLVSSGRKDASVILPYLVIVFALLGAVVFVSWHKTNGEWRWRWGPKQN
jgi:amino acid transporter